MSRGICVIGVGGTGQNILISLKERLIETYGRVPNSVVLLSLDTAAPEASMSISGVNLKLSGSQRVYVTDADRADHGEIEPIEQFLMQERKWVEEGRPDEFFPLVTDTNQVQSVDEVLARVANGQVPHFKDWVDLTALNELPQANKNIAAGAGQYRPIGRMALFLNYREVYGTIAAALQRLFAADVLTGDKYNIFVTGSVAGGTGAGIFIDTLVILRKILRQMEQGGNKRSVSLSTFLVLPSAFQRQHSIKEEGNLRPNSYAALREFDRFQLTHSLTRPTVVRYGPGVSDIQWVVDTLSDHVYLVDALSSNPRYSAFPAVADFIAAKVTDARLPDGTPGGGGAMIENLENNFDARFYDRHRRKRYLGLNTFTYVVPINDIVRSISFRYLHEMYQRLFAPAGSSEQAARVQRETVLRVERQFSDVRIETLSRNFAPESTPVPALLRAVINATKVHEPKSILIDWVSLLQLLARNSEEYQEDYKAFQQSLNHIEGALLTSVEYTRKEEDKEAFDDGTRRLIRIADDLMDNYLGPQHDPKDPQSRTGGHWDVRLSKYDELRDAFARALDFALRDELNLRDPQSDKLVPNRLAAARLFVENIRARLQAAAADMEARMAASGAPERYVSLLTRELKETQAEMEETEDDKFIPLLMERPLKKQKAYIEAVQEYLGLELSLRIFAQVKRLLDIFGAQDAYEWKDDEGRVHKASSVVARALNNLENWRQTLEEVDGLLEEAHKRHETGRRDKSSIQVRRYLSDSTYEGKIYQTCLPILDKNLQGKGADGATPRLHWAPKRKPDNNEDEPPLTFELDLAWMEKTGAGPVDIAIHFMQGARDAVEPIVRERVTIAKRLYEMPDFENDPGKLARALDQKVGRPLLSHSAQGSLHTDRIMAFPYKGPKSSQRFIQDAAERWLAISQHRKVDARNTLEPGESAAALTTVSFTGAVALTDVQQFTTSEAAYRLRLSETGKPLHVFPEEQQAVEFEQQIRKVFSQASTPTLSPDVVISMANKQKLLVFAAACAYNVIRREVVDPNVPLISHEIFLFLPGESGLVRKQLSHSALIKVPAGQQVSEGRQFLDALQQFCIVKTKRVGMGAEIAGLVIRDIEGELLRDPLSQERPMEQIHPFSLDLNEVERSIQEARARLGPSFNEEPDPRKKNQKNAANCLDAIAQFRRNRVDAWLESEDTQVRDLGFLIAILLNEISVPLREQAGD